MQYNVNAIKEAIYASTEGGNDGCPWQKPSKDAEPIKTIYSHNRPKGIGELWNTVIDAAGDLDGWLINIVLSWASDLVHGDAPTDLGNTSEYADSFCDVYYGAMMFWLSNDRNTTRWDEVNGIIMDGGHDLNNGLYSAIEIAQWNIAERVITACIEWLEEYGENFPADQMEASQADATEQD